MTIDIRLAEIDSINPAYLLVTSQDEQPDIVPLNAGASMFVGAGSSCKIQLNSESVRQLHCLFLLGENRNLTVQDWNTGATYLNGQLISDEAVMQSGDIVSVGSYSFTAVLDAEFHKGLAAQLLCGDGISESVAAVPEYSEVSTHVEQSSRDRNQADEIDHATVVDAFNIGDNLDVECDIEDDQISKARFEYDIDADLKDDASACSGYDPLPVDLGISFGGGDANSDDEMSLLLMEVEQLRFQVADRDSQIIALKNDGVSTEYTPAVEDSDTVKLVSRLEELLVELKTSDDRIQSLEDLLRLSEDATAAERDERAQMDKWVSEIEKRLGQRELESTAEVDRLTKQLKVARDDTAVLQTQLRSVSVSGSDSDNQAEAVIDLNNKVEKLRVSLQEANEKNQELLGRPVQLEDEVDLRSKLREAQDELAKLRLEASQERAETARRRAELEIVRAELARHLSPTSRSSDSGDSRIQAMREHLKDIHEQEQATKVELQTSGLGGRISNLLSKLR